MHGTRNLGAGKRLALALACAATTMTAFAEPTHGSFPYAWRHRGAFAPQSMWYGHYPTRWRQWPGQEYQELSPTTPPAEEIPAPDEDSSGAPRPPDDSTLPRPGSTTPTPAEEPPIVPPLELPGTTPGGPLDFDPTNPLPMPSGNDPIPPLLPERTPSPGLEPGAPSTAPSTEPTTEPLTEPATEPATPPGTEPGAMPPLEGPPPSETPPLESPGSPTPTPSEPIPPLDLPGSGVEPLPQPTNPEPIEPAPGASVDAAMIGPRLGAALPNPRPSAGGEGRVSIGWVAAKQTSPAPEPTRFVPATGLRQLPPRPAATASSRSAVEQVAALEVSRRPVPEAPQPEPSVSRRRNPLRDGANGSASEANPLRHASGGR